MNQPVATVTICRFCGLRDENGKKIPQPANADLAAAIRRELNARGLNEQTVQVQLVGCMSVCDTYPTWGLQAEGRYTYTFSPAKGAEPVADFVKVYLEKPKGQPVYKADMPEGVLGTQIAKVPPPVGSFKPFEGEPEYTVVKA